MAALYSGNGQMVAMQQPTRTKKVLLYNTGGTLGMGKGNNGAYSPGKRGILEKTLREMSILHCKNVAISSNPEDFLILPSPAKGQYQVIYKIEEFDPLLDSSNMDLPEWKQIATTIHSNYNNYDGFVVLHGTDTMAHTASVLSFMCENLGKPIILTGSQIPIFESRSDGWCNLLDSLIIAGNYSMIHEVLICFSGKAFRGNRCIKSNSRSFSAFTSPNMAPLVTLDMNIKVDTASLFHTDTSQEFSIFTDICPNVVELRLYPGITSQTIQGLLQHQVKGIVLQTFGNGNAPTNTEFIEAITECKSKMLIFNISQCSKGSVSEDYATGKALSDVGVISGRDMTPEAALAKLRYILGKNEGSSIEEKREMMKCSLRGEMTLD